jgi:hypothetical protein
MASELHPSVLHSLPVPEWLRTLAAGKASFSALLRDAGQNSADGFHHTIREICQQPVKAWQVAGASF